MHQINSSSVLLCFKQQHVIPYPINYSLDFEQVAASQLKWERSISFSIKTQFCSRKNYETASTFNYVNSESLPTCHCFT